MAEHESNLSADHRNLISRRAALAGTAAIGALAQPAGVAVAQPVAPDPAVPVLVAAYHKARRGWHRAYDRRYKIEVAAYHARPDLVLKHPLSAGSIFGGVLGLREGDEALQLIGLRDLLEGAEASPIKERRNFVEHIAAQRDEIREMLERDGWFAAKRREARASARLEAPQDAALAAPVACPADLLAKMEVYQTAADWQAELDEDERSHGVEERLMLAIYRGLQAMAA